MLNRFLVLLSLFCLLAVAGCGSASAGHGVTATRTASPTEAVAATPTEALAANSPWRKLWTLPALSPLPPGFSPQIPQIAWSPVNAQRLYLCRTTPDEVGAPGALHDLYRSDDRGLHWTAYPLPEAAASCRLEVDPTNAEALVLLDGMYHTDVRSDSVYHAYVSRDGGQTWKQIPDPPQWNPSLAAPVMQIMAGRLYVEGYWTDDLTHWTRWYPVAGEQQHVSVQINPQRPQTLYTTVDPKEFRCAGTPSTLHLLGGAPTGRQALLCRSDDGGQTWRFLVVVVVVDFSRTLGYWTSSTEPVFCLALNHPETLYALGYTAQTYPNPYPGDVTGDAMQSTDGGTTWTRLPAIFVGGSSGTTNFDPCGANAYAGQSLVSVDWDYAPQGSEWGNFGVTADGSFYHVIDAAGTRQGVTMSPGVSLLTDAGWRVIAPYPDGVTTPFTSTRLRMLLMTPPSGGKALLAFTDQNVYEYPMSGG